MSKKTLDQTRWIWIYLPKKNQPNQYVEFRRTFTLAALPKRAGLRISVDTNFAAWINGQFVGCGQFTDFPDRRTFSQIDLARMLRAGQNVLAILVHYCGEDHFSYLSGDAELWYELEVDGSVVARSDNETLCRNSPCYLQEHTARFDLQMGFTFHYNASGEDPWRQGDYRGGVWQKVAATDEQALPQLRPLKMLELRPCVDGVIIAQGLLKRTVAHGRTVAELMQQDYLSARHSWDLFEGLAPNSAPAKAPVTLSEVRLDGADGMYVLFDLGREECGFPVLDIDSAGGTVIDLAVGEHLDDLRVRASIGGRNFASRYVARPGRQTLVHYLHRYAGRYIQFHITKLQGTLELHRVGLIPAEYPVEFTGEFDGSDALANRIWQTSRRTLHLCMHEHYEDCPWREQALYANDSRSQMLCGYYAFGGYDFPRVSLELLARSASPDGYLELCAPMKFAITIPSFTMTWLLAMNDYLMYSGDTAFIMQTFPLIRQMLGCYRDAQKDYLLPCPTGKRYWQFYDWAPGLDGTDNDHCRNSGVVDVPRFDAPLNLFYLLALQATANMAKFTDEKNFADHCIEHAERLKQAAHRAFWDARENAYQTCVGSRVPSHFAELTQSLAILAGVGDKATHRTLRTRLMTENNGLVPTTLSQSLYKFEALMGDPACEQFVFDTIHRDWSKMLFFGATSFWETQNGAWDFHHAGSLCHGWSGIPVYIYGAYGLGLKPLEPGFTRLALKPLSHLAALRGTVPTACGDIRIMLERANGAYRADLQLPKSVDVVVDHSRVAECTVSNGQ
ncbi:MAG: hypothetical protein WC975_16205 [Phycisphaerae bacterium]